MAHLRARPAAPLLAALLLSAPACAPMPMDQADPTSPASPADPAKAAEAAGGASAAGATSPEIERLAERLAQRLVGRDLDTVGVRGFQSLRGDVTELGRHLAEELEAALANALGDAGSGAPRVIDRFRTAEILAERSFEGSGLVAADEIRRGALGGIDGLVTGTIVSHSDRIVLSVKVVHVEEHSEVLLAESADLARTDRIDELEGRTLKLRHDRAVDPVELWSDRPPLESRGLGDAGEPEKLRVDLRGCGRLEETVHCLFSIRALDRGRSVHVYGASRAVLPDGSRVVATRVQVGTATAAGPKSRAGEELARDVPTSAVITFEGIGEEVGSILRLILDLYGEEPTFESVPIDRL